MNARDPLPQQLAGWLAATDIGYLELRGPQLQLRLRNDHGRVEAVDVEPPAEAPAAALLPVRAPTVGVFRQAHPLRAGTPAPALAEAGQPVHAGQTLGLLQIGALLLPVTAPCSGVLLHWHVAHGGVVGYGAHLADIAPLAEPAPTPPGD